jgi:hypothetical protein
MKIHELLNENPISNTKIGTDTNVFRLEVPQGNKGPTILDLQNALIALGYTFPKFGADGVRGPETAAAVRKFQQDNQLAVDGIPGPQTIAKLNTILANRPEITKNLRKSSPQDVKPVGPEPTIGGNGDPIEALVFFIDKGWTSAQAAGIVGNLQAESGPNLKINAVGDNGKAYGIAQWHPPRQRDFARIFKKDIRQSSFQEQLEFIDWELKNTEKRAGNFLRQAKTPEVAAAMVDMYYERSSGAHRQKRINYAQSLTTNYAKLSAPTTKV